MTFDRWIALAQIFIPILCGLGLFILKVAWRVEKKLDRVDELELADQHQWRVLLEHDVEIRELQRRIP